MSMIVFHIDTQSDTAILKYTYEGLTDAKVYVNPKRVEVEEILAANPGERVMLMGHGSPSGLFSSHLSEGYVIDRYNAYLLKDREVIGIWCYAKKFGKNQVLKGYFTNMFISNEGEAKLYGYKATNDEVFDEVRIFSERIRDLIADGTPLDEWVDILQGQADYEKPFVEFNYSAMEYFDGTQTPDPVQYGFGNYGGYTKSAYSYFDDEKTAPSGKTADLYVPESKTDYYDPEYGFIEEPEEVDVEFEKFADAYGVNDPLLDPEMVAHDSFLAGFLFAKGLYEPKLPF